MGGQKPEIALERLLPYLFGSGWYRSGWRSRYFHLMMRRGRKTAKVAMARKLAVRLYWMWRKGWDYEQFKKFGSHAGKLGPDRGVQSNTK
jgi:hypothetical protein